MTLAPKKTHMRSKDLIAGADEIVAIEILHIQGTVRGVVHSIEKNLRAHGVCHPRRLFNVYDGPQRV